MRRYDKNITADLMKEQMSTEKEIHYSCDSYEEYLIETFLKQQVNKGLSAQMHVDRAIWVKEENIQALIEDLKKKFNFVVSGYSWIVLLNDHAVVELRSAGEDLDQLKIISTDKNLAEEISALVETHVCTDSKISINWIYSADGRSIQLIEEYDEVVNVSHYPFIENFETYVDRFMKSRSNILILQGDPGTGKTTFLRHLISQMDKQAYITYDSAVLSNDHSFAAYMEDDDAGAFIIEDADLFLKSRADGNGMVSRFLNIGDGLIRLKNKKLIFSTNLPNLRDIDAALIRPGRCFDILQFRPLTRAEAQVIADERKLVLPEGKQSFTIAEVFNSPIAKAKPSSSFGFIPAS